MGIVIVCKQHHSFEAKFLCAKNKECRAVPNTVDNSLPTQQLSQQNSCINWLCITLVVRNEQLLYLIMINTWRNKKIKF